MMIMCTKQHLSNIWNSIHEKVKQHWDWVEKKRCLQKKSMHSCWMKFWTEFPMLDEMRYSHSHTFIQNVSSNILKFKILKVHPFNNSKWRT